MPPSPTSIVSATLATQTISSASALSSTTTAKVSQATPDILAVLIASAALTVLAVLIALAASAAPLANPQVSSVDSEATQEEPETFWWYIILQK